MRSRRTSAGILSAETLRETLLCFPVKLPRLTGDNGIRQEKNFLFGEPCEYVSRFLLGRLYTISPDKNTNKNPLDKCAVFAAAASQNWPFFCPDSCNQRSTVFALVSMISYGSQYPPPYSSLTPAHPVLH